MKKIIPSIIANSQRELDKRINGVKQISNVFHLDIMDGKFVRNKSLMFNFKLIKNKKYVAHLMIKNPKNWINRNWKKVDTIIFHATACKNEAEVRETIKLIKSKKIKVGLALNPKISIDKIKNYLERIDVVLVMTVNPGKYGAKFLPKTLKKVKQLRKLRSNLKIEVDGGISDKTISLASKSGANSFVVGSYIQNSESPKKAIKNLMKSIM